MFYFLKNSEEFFTEPCEVIKRDVWDTGQQCFMVLYRKFGTMYTLRQDRFDSIYEPLSSVTSANTDSSDDKFSNFIDHIEKCLHKALKYPKES